MSQDISVFKNADMDDPKALPEGFYVGTFDGAQCVEAVGPYSDAMTAAIKMTTSGGCVWLHGDAHAFTYRWNGERFVVARAGPPLTPRTYVGDIERREGRLAASFATDSVERGHDDPNTWGRS